LEKFCVRVYLFHWSYIGFTGSCTLFYGKDIRALGQIDIGGEIQETDPLWYNKGRGVFPCTEQEASDVNETPTDP
jgi:hypothetical protein